MGKNVILTPDEAQTVTALLLEDLDNLGKGESAETQRRLWRLVVKLDKAAGPNRWDGLGGLDFPLWVRKLLQQTFAPDQVAPKRKPAPAKTPTPPHLVYKPRAASKKSIPPKASVADVDRVPLR